ncbi:hypothetical protein [Bacillus sp. FJAT-27445]|uniref:hypothetical protein n=1 Tax=Bacillus sp. FJAT-27445 TaxID=1679166 RepID=UPI000743E007|nr:hypothetical protein [Bacillus sp. FJAT-27445]
MFGIGSASWDFILAVSATIIFILLKKIKWSIFSAIIAIAPIYTFIFILSVNAAGFQSTIIDFFSDILFAVIPSISRILLIISLFYLIRERIIKAFLKKH